MMENQIFEKAFLVKLFHNPHLVDDFLDETIPSILGDKKRRLILFLMQTCKKKKLPINIGNLSLMLMSQDEKVVNFIKHQKIQLPTEQEITDILYDADIDSSDKLFDVARKEVLLQAFARFVQERLDEMNVNVKYIDQPHQHAILAGTKAIQTVHKMLYGRIGKNSDQLLDTMRRCNNNDEYIKTSSEAMNKVVGGMTRGYIQTLIAKSGHCKSTWADYNAVQMLASGHIKRVVKITPEEESTLQWRRIISMLNGISTTAIRQKIIPITQEHINVVKKVLDNKLFIYDKQDKVKDISDILQGLIDVDMVIIDHINAIAYEGSGNFLDNMIRGIPGFVQIQKRIAKEKNMCILNLSQVADKDIQRSSRANKAPRYWDAFASSSLYQVSREFFALWYPYKDYEDEQEHYAFSADDKPSIHDVKMSIEKSSLTGTGKVSLHYEPEYARFSDRIEAIAPDNRKSKKTTDQTSLF